MTLMRPLELQALMRVASVGLGLLWMFWQFSTPGLAADFSGKFDGIGTAVGMTLSLEEAEGRVVGRFASGRGDPFALNGRRTGEAAQGSVLRAGQMFFFHLEARPLGVQFLLIPKAPDGGPDMSGATDYSFVQQGLQVPQPSAFQAPPPRGIEVDILDFIDSFRDWDPVDMARVYGSLNDRFKGLIQLFDHAAAEILWRVCVTQPPNSSFSASDMDRLMERQRTDCTTYLQTVTAARDAGLLNEFLRKANFQFELIRETVKCDRGVSPETKCADVSAMSGPLMVRWRRAPDIMTMLVGDDVPIEVASEQPVTPTPGQQAAETPAQPGNAEIASVDTETANVLLPLPRPGARAVVTSDVKEVADEMMAGEVPPDDGDPADTEEVAQALSDQSQSEVPLPRQRPGVRLRQ